MADGDYFMGAAQSGVGNLMGGGGPPGPPGGFHLGRLGITDDPAMNVIAQIGAGWLTGRMGMIQGPFFPGQNYAASIRQRQYFLEQQEAMRRAAGIDMQAGREMITGFAKTIGMPLSPEVLDLADKAGKFFEPYAPLMAQMKPKTFDGLLGASGSMMGLALGVHEAGRTSIDPTTGAIGMTGASAGFMAQDLYRTFYGEGADPSLSKGLGGTQLGGLFGAMSQRGMIRPTAGMMDPASIAQTLARPGALQELAKTDPEALAGLTRAANPGSGDVVRSHGLGRGDIIERRARLHGMGRAGTVNADVYDEIKPTLEASVQGNDEPNWEMGYVGSYMARKLSEAKPGAARKFAGIDNLETIGKIADREGLGDQYNKILKETKGIDLAENRAAMAISTSDLVDSKHRVKDIASVPDAVRAGLDELNQSDSKEAYDTLKKKLGFQKLGHEDFINRVADSPELAREAVTEMASLSDTDNRSWNRMARTYIQKGANRDPGAKNAASQAESLGEDTDKLSQAVADLEKIDPEKYNRLTTAIQSGQVKKSLASITGAVAAMSDVFGSKGVTDAPMSALLQGISNLTAGSETAVSGNKLEMMVRRASVSAETSGMGIDRFQLAVQQGSALAQQQGLSGKFGVDIGAATSDAYAAAKRGSGVGVDNFYKDTPEAVAATSARLRVQGIASQAGNNSGAILRAIKRADESGDPNAASPELRSAAYALTHGGVDEQGRKVDMAQYTRPDAVLNLLARGTDMGREGAALFLGNRRANTAELHDNPEAQAGIGLMQQGERIKMNTSLMLGGAASTLRGLGLSASRANRMAGQLSNDLAQAVMGVGPNGMTEGQVFDEPTRNRLGAAVIAQRMGKNFDTMDEKEKARLTRAAGDMYGYLDSQLKESSGSSIAQQVQQSGVEKQKLEAQQRGSTAAMAEIDSRFAGLTVHGPFTRLTESFRERARRDVSGEDSVSLLGGIRGAAGKFMGALSPDEAKRLLGPAPSPEAQNEWKRMKEGLTAVTEGKVPRPTGEAPATEAKPSPADDDKAGAAPENNRGTESNPLYVKITGAPRTPSPIADTGHVTAPVD